MSVECNKFDSIKKLFIDMLIDIKEFETVSTKNKVYIDIILNIIDTFDNETFFNTINNITDCIKDGINENNYKDVIINCVQNIEIIHLNDHLSFLSNLKPEEIIILVQHLKILFAYIVKIKTDV